VECEFVSVRIGRPPHVLVLVVMDHWTRRVVGVGVHRGAVDGVALCRRFNHATSGQSLPTYLSADQRRSGDSSGVSLAVALSWADHTPRAA